MFEKTRVNKNETLHHNVILQHAVYCAIEILQRNCNPLYCINRVQLENMSY